jgi:hypothetical protein
VPRRAPRLALVYAALSLASCTLSERDIDAFQDTATGPDKLRAVLHDAAHPATLRARAALNLLDLARRNTDGRSLLFNELDGLDQKTRGAIVPGFKDGLKARMRTEPGHVPSAQSVRAKDAGVELLAMLSGDERALLGRELLTWMGEDFALRADSGRFHLEAVADAVGPRSAETLLASMALDLPAAQVLRVARVLAQKAQGELRTRVSERVIAIDQAYRLPAHDSVLTAQARREAYADRTVNAAVSRAQVAALRRSALMGELMPALGLFSDEPRTRSYLVALSRRGDVEPEQRSLALTLLADHVTPAEVSTLLELALDADELPELREIALTRAGETRAHDALPALLTLVGDRGHSALRRRAGELALEIGGAEMLPAFFRSLPHHWDTQYDKREIDAYAERMAKFPPDPGLFLMLGERLHSVHWWHRVLALRYFAARGNAEDVWRVRQHLPDTHPVVGEGWPHGHTVGQEALTALNVALQRLRLSGPVASSPLPVGDGQGEGLPAPAKPRQARPTPVVQTGEPAAEEPSP